MDLTAFERSLEEQAPPEGLSKPLRALWREAKGEWDAAHSLAQADAGPAGAWVHAYLHRVEGDLRNAGYWYRRAGRSAAEGALRDEWRMIAAALLAEGQPLPEDVNEPGAATR